MLAYLARFGRAAFDAAWTSHDATYLLFGFVLATIWFIFLSAFGTRDGRVLGFGFEEYGRVLRASLWLFASIALISYLFKLEIARGYIAFAFPFGIIFLVFGRHLVRRWLERQRNDGRFLHRVLVIAGNQGATRLSQELAQAPYAGLHVVDVVTLQTDGESDEAGHARLIEAVVPRAQTVGADTIIVDESARLSADSMRRLGWSLEQTSIDLVVAPRMTEIAGPRLHVRTVEGLPLLHLEQPAFAGGARFLKDAFDSVVSFVALVLLTPVFAVLAVVIAISDPGPVFFRQLRIGQDGRPFTCWKFRTMVVDADSLKEDLTDLNEKDAVTFKITDDPRITSLGKFLRRWSIDELPQLLNVLRGQMSLVGPRPPLAEEVAQYENFERRRLLVKPGLTGLWQVSGRADLSWEDSVRLDLYYVENWSFALDLVILARTVNVVIKGQGAY
jgi:exopolysaccharide biosynthesis polyprenyl glycosylphosphotransferase